MKIGIGDVQHYWHEWHLVKWFGNNLRKEAKYMSCAPLIVWYEKLKTHMWKAIEVGEGESIRHIFNTVSETRSRCAHWPKEDATGPYTACDHAPLEGAIRTRPEVINDGTAAFERLERLVLNKTLQRDLAEASHHGGTSVCESKNALDRLRLQMRMTCCSDTVVGLIRKMTESERLRWRDRKRPQVAWRHDSTSAPER